MGVDEGDDDEPRWMGEGGFVLRRALGVFGLGVEGPSDIMGYS